MSNKKALIVGINYPGTDHALRGCVNDAMTMSEMLTAHYGFNNPKNKRMLTDASATTANILERLNWLVDGAQPGDVLFFHYSGHGSQLVDTKYDDDSEPDGLDEIICPVDLNWRDKVIRDDDFKHIFARVPEGVNLTVVLDCCHSGGGLDSRYEYMPYGVATPDADPLSPNRSRLMRMPADIANRAIGLDIKPKPRPIREAKSGILISGCQAQQTSADAWIHNKYMGAATFFINYSLQTHGYNNISYKDLVVDVNNTLSKYGYAQRPQLDCVQKEFFNRNFLQPFV
jgi:hypothetical protein